MKMCRRTLCLLIISSLSMLAVGQSLSDPGDSSGAVASKSAALPDLPYTRPTQAIKLRNYFFDAFGP